jgi:hypothetical protein
VRVLLGLAVLVLLAIAATTWLLTTSGGAQIVQSICDFVHGHILFGYEYARPTKSAWETYREQTGVCRDFAHLAVALCRCMNIPARYCTGYLGDIGVPVSAARWISAPGSRPISGAGGTPSTRSTTGPDRAHRHGARTRRHRCRDQHDLRRVRSDRVPGHHQQVSGGI